MNLSNQALKKIEQYTAQMAEANGVRKEFIEGGHKYNVEPSVQQKLESQVKISSDFLKQINIVGVSEMAGEALKLGVTKTIAGRKNTNAGETRSGVNITGLTSNPYLCQQTNFDTLVSYAQLDAWSKFKDFASRIAKLKAEQMQLDRIMIGWHGEQVALTTDRVKYPLLQDVNIGWLKKIELRAPEQVIKSITMSTKGYKTLDSIVYDMVDRYLPEAYRNDPNVVVIVGRKLLGDKYFPLQNDPKATEALAGDVVISQKRVGGLKAVRAPFFPEDALLITRLDNLSIYYQEGAMRRLWKDNPERDSYVDFVSSNEDYVVENPNAVVYVRQVVNPNSSIPKGELETLKSHPDVQSEDGDGEEE